MPREIHMLVVHHSASSLATTVAEIEEWHKARGWKGIGYHHVVTGDGVLHVGRPLDQVGAHALGYNSNSIGLCLVGDNTKAEESWTSEQRLTLVQYVHWFRRFFPLASIHGHGDLGDARTVCPGIKINDLLKALGAV